MGNKMSRRRVVVDEKYTRPQGLYPQWDIDLRKLRSLILDAKLAPCYRGEDESAPDLEDCPICFLEEQKVIEAQIRMQLQELQEDAERIKKKQVSSLRYTAEDDEFVSSRPSSSVLAVAQSTYSRQDSDENYDLDLEDVMVLEAIRRSLQETQVNPVSSGSTLAEAHHSDRINPQLATSSEIPPPDGFASAIAAIAEHQHMSGEVFASAYQMLQSSRILHARDSNVSTTSDSPVQWADVTPSSTSLVVREQGERSTEWWSDEAEAGTSYAASNASATSLALSENQNLPAGHFLPESFEDQMMVALALSLAEA